jgi:hypothetical protein
LVDGKYQVTLSESEDSKSQRSGTDSERQSETLRSNGDAGPKTLRQLQAEDDEEERFQADLKRAKLQSLGRFSTILVYISCLTGICMKHGLLYTYTTSLHLCTHSFIYFL